MEPQLIDYYNEMPSGINVINKMNEELDDLQKKYDELKSRYEPGHSLEIYIRRAGLSCTHFDVANIVYNFYKDKFKCKSIKKNEWYFYDDEEKKWKLSDGDIEIRMKLSNEILKMFQYRATSRAAGDSINYYKVCNNLKNLTYKNTIIKECKYLFYDKNFDISI